MSANDAPRDRAPSAVGTDADLADLLVRVADGDRAAFAALYDAVAPRVFGLALRLVRNRAMAEEVAQDVLMEVWRTAARFDRDRGSATGWILMLAHRRSVDRIRRSESRTAREERAASRVAVAEPVDEALLDDEERRELTGALDALTPLQREALELAYYEGHTYRQVAEVLDIPEGTAKSRLRDGIRALRATLGGGAR